MINPATWQTVIEKNGLSTAEGQITHDPFLRIAQEAASFEKGGYPQARVNVTVTNGAEYGMIKVSVNITVPCPPTENHIQTASEAAFLKATEMVNEASESVGLPALPAPYE